MPERTALGSEPSRLPGRRRAGTAGNRTGSWAGRLPGGESTLRPSEPGLKGSGSCADEPPRPLGEPRPLRKAAAPPPSTAALHAARGPRRDPHRGSAGAARGRRHRGFGQEPPAAAARPLRPCRRRSRRACYVQFSNQLEFSMPSVSSWAAGEPAPPCARALRCGLARARASTPRLLCARGLLRGYAAPCGISAGPGALPAPGRAPGFQNVPASVCVPHPHSAGDSGGGGAG